MTTNDDRPPMLPGHMTKMVDQALRAMTWTLKDSSATRTNIFVGDARVDQHVFVCAVASGPTAGGLYVEAHVWHRNTATKQEADYLLPDHLADVALDFAWKSAMPRKK
jgi:hypothetical protein